MSRALIVVDVQNDFCEGGALAVRGGNEVASRVANHVKQYGSIYDFIAFTKDSHKPWPDTNGGHFSENPDFVDSWPVHCVEGTHGAEFHPEILALPKGEDEIFYKGYGRPDYSGFQGYNSTPAPLAEVLRQADVSEVDIVGIAGDYCVKATALDAIKQGFRTRILPLMVTSVGGIEATHNMLFEVSVAQSGASLVLDTHRRV